MRLSCLKLIFLSIFLFLATTQNINLEFLIKFAIIVFSLLININSNNFNYRDC